MRAFSRILMIGLVLAGLSATDLLAANAEQSYRNARDAYYALQNSARKQMYRDHWERVIDKFAAVYQEFPATRRGADALYMKAKATDELYDVSRIDGDALQAADRYLAVADRYPDSSLADDALLRAAELQESVLGEPRQAYLIYQRLVSEHPRGDMVALARDRLERLQAYQPPAEPPPAPKPATAAAPASRPAGAPARPGDTLLTAVRFWSNPGYTRIVLDLSRESEFSAHFLAPDQEREIPPRLYVDLPGSRLADGLDEPTVVNDGLLQRIRTGHPDADTVRVVLDLKSIGDYKVFPLADPYRVVIDIAGERQPELKRRDPELHALPDSGRDEIARVLNEAPRKTPELHIPATAPNSTLRRIVVDAGHGGKDPGAIGPGGTYEKDITLALAKRLAGKLRKELGCEVILTRSGDVYLPLEERTAIANKVGADLFVSIHANANNSRQAHGIETYYLNFSKNDKAAAVAARENGTSLKQVSDLELILFDLMANAKINESSRLAAEIQKNLVDGLSRKYDHIRDLGVRQGPFYVLLGATMPSVLVETAFISNPREEKRLKSSRFQDHAVDAIARAIKNYAVANKLIAAR